MKRLDHLVLDALEQLGPDAKLVRDIAPWVRRRRWLFSYASLYLSLWRLERLGLVTSRWEESKDTLDARGGYRRRLYSVAYVGRYPSENK